ncbi:MAG TPA: hypothetical protein VFV93_02810, partial [Thermomicrobiales bacterium]|nr:hypothetical protein [Thermomicrobiales bacterium]
AAYFVAINLIGITILLAGGTVGQTELAISAALTPAALVGTLIGNRLVRRFTAAQFRRLTLGLLLLTGLMGVATAVAALV